MPPHQRARSGSGFGPGTTATDVLRGIDLRGRHVVVTGGYSGLGLATTKALADAGATVSVPARRADIAAAALAGVPRVEIGEMGLADLATVDAYARTLLDAGRPIDVIINNAGVMAAPLTRVGPGWELQFAVNHLGHFALTNHLWPLLNDGARVVSVSSRGHFYSPIQWDDPMFEHTDYDRWVAYGQSTTANSLFAVHLDRLGRESGVRAFAVHPGAVFTPLARHMSREELIEFGALDAAGNRAPRYGVTPEEGASTQVWAATSPQLSGRGGLYLEEVDIADLFDETIQTGGVQPYALDEAEAARLWALSATLTGVNAFA